MDISGIRLIPAYHLRRLQDAKRIFVPSDNDCIGHALPQDVSPDRDISSNIKCFFYQCKDFSCNKKIFRMYLNTVMIKTVDHDRSAHPDKRGQFSYLAVPRRTDVPRKFFPYFSRKRHDLTLSFL